jgi:hypothetical protein
VQKKKPAVTVTAGFEKDSGLSAGCHSRKGGMDGEFAGWPANRGMRFRAEMQHDRKYNMETVLNAQGHAAHSGI